jgi:hypothetical protein
MTTHTPGRILVALVLAGAVAPVVRAAEATDLSRCETRTAERLRFIEERLEQRRPYATWWWRGWTGAYGIGTVLQSVRAGIEDDSDARKADLTVGAVKALIGTTRLLFDRPNARLGAEPMQAIVPSGEAACRERLAVGEELLRKNAKQSDSRWDWKRHAGNVALNSAGAAIVAYGFGDELRGWRSAGVGIAVGEAMILSYPWHGDDDLAEYERRFQGAATPRTSLRLVPWGSGARLVLNF